MAIRGRVTIILSIWASFCFLCFPAIYNPDENFLIPPPSSYSSENGSSAAMTSGASSEITIEGEPSHIGDPLTGTIIVTNSGNETGIVSLRIFCGATNSVFVGSDVIITPGSSREVSSSFIPEIPGTIDCTWSVESADSPIDQELRGNFSFESLPPQDIEISPIEQNWEDNALSTQFSVYLSSGRSRPVNLLVFSNSSNSDTVLQEIPIILDPGVRLLQIGLGEVNLPQIYFEIIPKNWQISDSSINITSLMISKNILQSTDLSIEASVEQSSNDPENQQLRYQISNSGSIDTLPGNIRLISLSDMQVVQESTVPSIGPSGSLTGFFTVPVGQSTYQGDIQIIWSAGKESVSSTVTFDSVESSAELALPFDLLAASYGILAGITLILVGRLVWRSVSTRTPKTSESSFRVTRKERETKESQKKKLVICPHCEQQLNVPSIHSGTARCPTCSLEFQVKDGGDSTEKKPISNDTDPSSSGNSELTIVRSSDDLLNCPDCDQALRVPIEKRPVRSRCPICKLEFIAEIMGD